MVKTLNFFFFGSSFAVIFLKGYAKRFPYPKFELISLKFRLSAAKTNLYTNYYVSNAFELKLKLQIWRCIVVISHRLKLEANNLENNFAEECVTIRDLWTDLQGQTFGV